MGGYLHPSVLRSPGVSPQKCRAAHGPLHLAVTYPLRLCRVCVRFSVGLFRDHCWLLLWVLFLSLRLECCLFFRPLGPDPCLPSCWLSSLSLFLSFCLVCVADDVSLLAACSFFLSQALGKPKPLWFVFPLVFLHRGRALQLQSVLLALHLHQGQAPHPFFFFFPSSSFAGSVAVGCVCGWLFSACFGCAGSLSPSCCLHARV